MRGARVEHPALQISEYLAPDQSFVEQAAESRHYLTQGRLTQKPHFKLRREVGILSPQGIESAADCIPTLIENLSHYVCDTLTKDRMYFVFIERTEMFNHKAHALEHFCAIGEAIGQKPDNTQPAIQEIGDAEAKREC